MITPLPFAGSKSCPRCGKRTSRIRSPFYFRPLRVLLRDRSSTRSCALCGWHGLTVVQPDDVDPGAQDASCADDGPQMGRPRWRSVAGVRPPWGRGERVPYVWVGTAELPALDTDPFDFDLDGEGEVSGPWVERLPRADADLPEDTFGPEPVGPGGYD